MRYRWLGLFFTLILAGCQTVKSLQAQKESAKEAQSALGSVAGAVVGRELTNEEQRRLEQQIKTDPEAQKAVEAITNTMSNPAKVIKYCPVDGKRFASSLQECPEHKVLLKVVGQ